MKVLLVNPYFKGAVPIPSFGLGYIASYIKEQTQCDVEIVDQNINGIPDPALDEKVLTADIIGLVCYTESRFEVFDFAEKTKKANPSCLIMIGGAHVQTLDTLILKHYPFVDIIVRMEGEAPVLDIVKGVPFEQINGITWRDKDGNIIQNPPRQVMEDIDQVPFDYRLIENQIHGWKDVEIPLSLQSKVAFPLVASRGCPFKCKFCAANRQWGTTYRWSSPEALLKRLEQYIKDYDVGYFRFYDALFIGSEPRLLKLCDLIEASGLKFSFRVDVRIGTSPVVLERLRKAGCDVLGFGIESGSDRILKRINKGITRKQIFETLKVSRDLGYWNIGFFMISLPDETMEDIEETFSLLNEFDEGNVQFFKIHPNTAFYDELKDRGEINDEVWFDKSHGSELFYCKERFKSANLSFDEANALVRYGHNKIKLSSYKEFLSARGPIKGCMLLCIMATENAILRSSAGRRLHSRLSKMDSLRAIYKSLSGGG